MFDCGQLRLLWQKKTIVWWIPITNKPTLKSLLLSFYTDECLCMILHFGPIWNKHCYISEGHCCVHHIYTLVDKLRSANLLNITTHTYICYSAHYKTQYYIKIWWWCLLSKRALLQKIHNCENGYFIQKN